MPNPVFVIIAVRTFQFSIAAFCLHWLLGWPLTGPHALGFVFTPLLCVYFLFVFTGNWTWGLPITNRLREGGRCVALTFDDGPSADVTPRILDTLQTYGASATFFVLGHEARKCPALVRRMSAEGHMIALHGDSHQPMVLMGWGKALAEIEDVRAALTACGVISRPCWLRPPHGFKTLTLPFIVRHAGLRLAAWNVNPRDYHAETPEEIADAVLSRVRPGSIVLLHDGTERSLTADALPLILEGLRIRGYRCAALPDLQRP